MQNISAFLSATCSTPNTPKSKTIKSLLQNEPEKITKTTLSKSSISEIFKTTSTPIRIAPKPVTSSTSSINIDQANEITSQILETKKELDKAKKLENKKEKKVALGRVAKIVKRKTYYQVCSRQKIRLNQDIKKVLAQGNDFLKSLGLCLSIVEINPIELDECDFKLKIRPPTSECPDKLEPNVNNLLYYKDKHSISDVAYGDLKKRCHLPIPSIAKLKQRRYELNSMFQIFKNEMGVYVSLKEKLEFRIKIFLENKYNDDLNSPNFEDDTIHIKLAADGTNIGRNLKLLNFTFTIINEVSRAKTANGNYTIGIFEIDNERHESLTKCFKEIIEELETLNHVEINGKKINLVYYQAGDWKMLAHSIGIQSANSKFPCVWCKCSKDEFYNLEREWSIIDPAKGCRTLEEHSLIINQDSKSPTYSSVREPIFKSIIPFSRYMIDMLHLYLRISDSLFNLLVKDLCLADGFEMGAISKFEVTSYKHMNAFQIFLNEKCSVKFQFLWVAETKKLTWRDLVGPEKTRLFEKFKLEEIYPSHPNFDLVSIIWNDFYAILRLVKTVSLSADDLKQKTREWLTNFLKVYDKTSVTPYMHAFVAHLHEFIHLYKDINAFNCQGLEKLNDLSTGQYFKGTNKQDSALHQILQKRNRMEYLSTFAVED